MSRHVVCHDYRGIPSMYICMNVYMCLCMYVCMCVCICMCVCFCVCMHAHVSDFLFLSIQYTSVC